MISYSDYLKLHQEEINNLIDLQKRIMNLNPTNIDDFVAMITKSNYIQEKSKLIRLLNSIQVGISVRPLLYELYFNVIEKLATEIKHFFSEHELISIFPKRPLVLKLFEKGLIGINTIYELCKKQKYNFKYFAPEIKEFNNELFESNVDEETKKSLNFEEMKKCRTKGQNSFLIAQFIRDDDCDNFQEYLSKTNTNVDSFLPLSEYEQCRLLSQKMKLIDYAAFFGSIKIFKFLVMNKCNLTNKTSQFAIAGGNYDIIHFIEDQKCSFNSCIEISIQFHHNEIFEYLIEKIPNKNEKIDGVFYASIQSYNAEIFYQYFENILNDEEKLNSVDHTILPLCAIHGISDFAHVVCSIKEINIDEKGYMAFYSN